MPLGSTPKASSSAWRARLVARAHVCVCVCVCVDAWMHGCINTHVLVWERRGGRIHVWHTDCTAHSWLHPTCRNVPPIPLHRHARVRLLLPPYDCHSTPVARERTILFGSTYCCVPCEYRVATFMTSERVARRFTAARVSCWVQRITHTAPHTTHAHPAKQHQQWVCVQYRHGYR